MEDYKNPIQIKIQKNHKKWKTQKIAVKIARILALIIVAVMLVNIFSAGEARPKTIIAEIAYAIMLPALGWMLFSGALTSIKKSKLARSTAEILLTNILLKEMVDKKHLRKEKTNLAIRLYMHNSSVLESAINNKMDGIYPNSIEKPYQMSAVDIADLISIMNKDHSLIPVIKTIIDLEMWARENLTRSEKRKINQWEAKYRSIDEENAIKHKYIRQIGIW